MKENRLTVARANEILIKTLLKRVERFARSCREKEIAGGTPIIRPRNRPTANEYLPTNHQVYRSKVKDVKVKTEETREHDDEGVETKVREKVSPLSLSR